MDFLKRASGGPGAMIRAAFVVVCILATAAALGIVLGRLLDIAPALAGGLVLLTLLVAALGLWALQTSRALETMRAHALALATFETSLADRLETMDAEAKAGAEAQKCRLDEMQSALATLEREPSEVRNERLSELEPEPIPGVLPKPAATNEPIAEAGSDTQTHTALQRDALSLHLQPIVSLPDRQPKHFLLTMRMQDDDGAWVDEDMLDRLTRTGRLLPQMERKMLFAALRIQGRLGDMNKRTSLVCPLSEQTLSNNAAFAPILAFARDNATLGPNVCFAIAARDVARLSAAARGRLDDLVAVGFGVARTGVTDLGGDIDAMAANGVRLLAVDHDTLAGARADETLGVGDPKTYAVRLRDAQIGLVVTGVDTERALESLTEHGVALAVGTLFAPPRPLRIDLEDDA